MAPEEFFPLPILKVNEFLRLAGQEHGASIAVSYVLEEN